jgi:hypothetical protein
MQEEKEIQHVICFSISDVEELPIGPARYIRTIKVRTLLGDELVLKLRSESRLALNLEAGIEGRVTAREALRRRPPNPEDTFPES